MAKDQTVSELIDAVESLQRDVEQYKEAVEEFKGFARRAERALEIHEANVHHMKGGGNHAA